MAVRSPNLSPLLQSLAQLQQSEALKAQRQQAARAAAQQRQANQMRLLGSLAGAAIGGATGGPLGASAGLALGGTAGGLLSQSQGAGQVQPGELIGAAQVGLGAVSQAEQNALREQAIQDAAMQRQARQQALQIENDRLVQNITAGAPQGALPAEMPEIQQQVDAINLATSVAARDPQMMAARTQELRNINTNQQTLDRVANTLPPDQRQQYKEQYPINSLNVAPSQFTPKVRKEVGDIIMEQRRLKEQIGKTKEAENIQSKIIANSLSDRVTQYAGDDQLINELNEIATSDLPPQVIQATMQRKAPLMDVVETPQGNIVTIEGQKPQLVKETKGDTLPFVKIDPVSGKLLEQKSFTVGTVDHAEALRNNFVSPQKGKNIQSIIRSGKPAGKDVMTTEAIFSEDGELHTAVFKNGEYVKTLSPKKPKTDKEEKAFTFGPKDSLSLFQESQKEVEKDPIFDPKKDFQFATPADKVIKKSLVINKQLEKLEILKQSAPKGSTGLANLNKRINKLTEEGYDSTIELINLKGGINNFDRDGLKKDILANNDLSNNEKNRLVAKVDKLPSLVFTPETQAEDEGIITKTIDLIGGTISPSADAGTIPSIPF
jgi:hypothetical protein